MASSTEENGESDGDATASMSCSRSRDASRHAPLSVCRRDVPAALPEAPPAAAAAAPPAAAAAAAAAAAPQQQPPPPTSAPPPAPAYQQPLIVPPGDVGVDHIQPIFTHRVGLLIGPGGKTLRAIQELSGASVHVVTPTGSQHAIATITGPKQYREQAAIAVTGIAYAQHDVDAESYANTICRACDEARDRFQQQMQTQQRTSLIQ